MTSRQPYPEPSAQLLNPVPVSVRGAVVVNAGGVCGRCGEPTFTTHYSLAHVILCIVLFPLGLLCLLAPVKRCYRCGNAYGLGAFLRSFVWGVIALVVLLMAVGALLVTNATSRGV